MSSDCLKQSKPKHKTYSTNWVTHSHQVSHLKSLFSNSEPKRVLRRATRPGLEATRTAQLAGARGGACVGRPWWLVHPPALDWPHAVPSGPSRELLEALRHGEAVIAEDVHDLAVAEDGDEHAAAGLGREREAAEEVEEAELVPATVEDVAKLHGEGGPHGP